jgi:nucleoside-diphosphate-sugar epimerase
VRIFVTGASGFIGAALVPELLRGGHQVVGLARSDSSAGQIAAAGAEVHRGSLEDLDSLQAGAAHADGVIHLAFIHDFADFSRFAAVAETERRAIEALASPLVGTDRPLIVTSGSGMPAMATPGRPATEEDPPVPSSVFPRGISDETAAAAAARGVRVSVMGLPQVHDAKRQGLVSLMIAMAREKGVSAFVGDGANRWPAVHVLDAARLYRLAIESPTTRTRYHAVTEEGVPVREIATAIGRGLDVPVRSVPAQEAGAHFGWLGHLIGADLPASSRLTREWLGWNPEGPGLIADLDRAQYVHATSV